MDRWAFVERFVESIKRNQIICKLNQRFRSQLFPIQNLKSKILAFRLAPTQESQKRNKNIVANTQPEAEDDAQQTKKS
jgi:hypothetical protein